MPDTLTLDQWLADINPTLITTIDLPTYCAGGGAAPFIVFKSSLGRAIVARPMSFDDHLCVDLHGFDGEGVQAVGAFGMTAGQRYRFGDNAVPPDTSHGLPATGLLAAIVGKPGKHTPRFEEPKGLYWKGRFIIGQDGLVDLPWDRSAFHGPGAHDPEQKESFARQLDALCPSKKLFSVIREKLLSREILTREAADVVLFENGEFRVRGNSNGSGGYFYVIAERLHEPRRFQVLDLSISHLATRELKGENGVTAYPYSHGWLMHVPQDPDGEAQGADDPISPDILALQLYARQVACDWVMFDDDGPINPNLKTFDRSST